MNPSPRVTVLMPVRNGEKYVQEAMGSILGQTYRDFEFLVIDDGSVDGTPEILSGCKDTRLRPVRHAACIGVARTLNEGLQLARGEFVARMDADDVSRPDRLEAQVAYMERHPEVGICGTWVRLIDAGEGEIARYPTDPGEIRCRLLFNNALAHPSVILRREMLEARGLAYDPMDLHVEDYALWVRSSRCFPLANLPQVLLDYRVHEGQIWKVYGREQEESAKRVRGEQLERLGIDPTEKETVLHTDISSRNFDADPDFVAAARSWLEKLHAANRRIVEYPEPAFTNLLKARWFEVCTAARRHGWWTWKTFRSTPLSEGVGQAGLRNLKFAVKCCLKHG